MFPNQSSKSWSLELHAFTDASLIGMAAVLFLRMYNLDKAVIECRFLISQSKAAPIKQLSLLKRELEAETLRARLLSFASKEIHLNRTAVLHVWTDSQVVVLDWIKSTKQQKTFVANRLTKISTMDHQLQWHHIPTTLNPADHGTRGLEPREIIEKWLTHPASGNKLSVCGRIILCLQQLW